MAVRAQIRFDDENVSKGISNARIPVTGAPVKTEFQAPSLSSYKYKFSILVHGTVNAARTSFSPNK